MNKNQKPYLKNTKKKKKENREKTHNQSPDQKP